MPESDSSRTQAKRQRTRICFVLPYFEPDTATHRLHTFELMERLSERADVCLIYSNEREAAPATVSRSVRIATSIRLLRALRYGAALLEARARGYRITYVHYHTLSAVWGSVISSVTGGRTYVWSCVKHDRYFATGRRGWGAMRQRMLLDRPIRLSYRLAQRIVACSSFMADHIQRVFGVPEERIRILENWVNPQRQGPVPGARERVRQRLGLPEDTPLVAYVHSLGENKGAHHLPELTGRIVAQCPGARVIVAGDGPLRSTLEERARERGLENDMILLGAVPNEEVAELLSACDVFINPANVEEFGRVILEAMVCGAPFVSTDGGGGVLAFTTPLQQRYVTPVGDLVAFAERVVRLLHSADERVRLRQEGMRHVRAFTLETAVSRFLEMVGETAEVSSAKAAGGQRLGSPDSRPGR